MKINNGIFYRINFMDICIGCHVLLFLFIIPLLGIISNVF
jgi:hypothetical protein